MTKDIIRVLPPSKNDLLKMRLLILLGVVSIVLFLVWFFSENRVGYAPLFWMLTAAWFFKILRTLHEWYHYYNISVPKSPVLKTKFSVDILTTACPGEPQEMIINTLHAMQAIAYPHTSYLCDEGDDPVLKKVCQELGVIHVTRKEKIDAKAGNINNALRQAKGDICIILDPDHVPIPELIDQVLPYFEDPKVGFVQSVQAYKNRKESLVALGACEQTYHFYGPMMMAMNSYGTAQAIGANCAFRRSALDSIGGHAAGLAEDMHTSMLLHSKGWKSVYVPEILTRGLVPSSLPAYYKQQLKWSRGTFDIFFKTLPKILHKLTFKQKLHYLFIPLYFFYGLIDFLNILIPILSLVLAEFPWQVDLLEFVKMTFPILLMTILIRQYAQKWLLERHERGFHFVGGLLRIGTWWIFSLGFIYTLFNIKVPYIPTPKEGTPENSLNLSLPNLIACLLTLLAIVYGLNLDWSPYSIYMSLLAFLNFIILGYVVIIGQQKTLISIFEYLNSTFLRIYIFRSRLLWWNARQSFYFFLRKNSFIAGCFTIALVIALYYSENPEYNYVSIKPENERVYTASILKNKNGKGDLKAQSYYRISLLPLKFHEPGVVANINLSDFKNKNILISIIIDSPPKNKLYDASKIEMLGEEIYRFNKPVFVKISTDNAGNEDNHYIQKAFKKVFERRGVSNVIWLSEDEVSENGSWLFKKINSGSTLNSFEVLSTNSTFQNDVPPLILSFDKKIGSDVIASLIAEYPNIRGVVSDTINNHGSYEQNKFGSNPSCFNLTYKLKVAGEDFQIKGIAYHDSRFLSGEHIPLTRSQVRKDFNLIKEMGANTVRRYQPSIYDRNIFETAEDLKLKIIYGFWFDPYVDYVRDSIKTKEYLDLIEKKVKEYKTSPSLLSWTLGNEATGMMEMLYDKPELIEMRRGYISFLERATKLIKEHDKAHPVSLIIPYNSFFRAVLREYKNFAPTADIIGINAYEKDQLKKVLNDYISIEKERPYFISEFGSGAYWNDYLFKKSNGIIEEPADIEKANQYFWNWIKYVDFCKMNCLGGVAYTWRDKNEGTATWFGITDFKGRLKPAYYSLKKVWREKYTSYPMPWVVIEGEELVKSSSTHTYRVIQEYIEEYHYEWFIQEEDTKILNGKMKRVGTSKELTLKVSKDLKDFRLYLFVSDNEGNVVTASKPVRVKQ